MELVQKWQEMVVKWPNHNVVTVFLKQTLVPIEGVCCPNFQQRFLVALPSYSIQKDSLGINLPFNFSN
jgi:hypothetical protein